MENEGNEESKIDKIKKHLKENWKIYVVGTGGVIAGAAGMAVFLTMKYGVTDDEMLEMGLTQVAAIIKDSKIKNSTVNLTQQTISLQGNKIGRPGIPVIDMTTRKRYESMSLAADAVGSTVTNVSNNAHGRTNNINGHKFVFPEVLAEMAE